MKVNLLDTVEQGGCSSKIAPKQLDMILKELPLPVDPRILVDINTHDDAGVYKLSDDLALVVTTDFFPPVCSDAYEFGEIAAANSLSDVYAMGAKPLIALNIMLFPATKLPPQVFRDILKGGFDKAAEAETSIIGGHTIEDETPKYGLAVTGTVHPEKIITNAGACEGDLLILTKPIGTGIVLAGQRLEMTSENEVQMALETMKFLNRYGSEIMQKYSVTGATDITGFGLAGHSLKMAKASNVSLEIKMKDVPLLEGVYRLADDGCLPGASFRNLDFVELNMEIVSGLDYNLKMIAMDAQTSGGLLMAVKEKDADQIMGDLKSHGHNAASVIGRVLNKSKEYLRLI